MVWDGWKAWFSLKYWIFFCQLLQQQQMQTGKLVRCKSDQSDKLKNGMRTGSSVFINQIRCERGVRAQDVAVSGAR